LQANVIVKLVRAGQQGPVTVSHSTDDSFGDYREDVHDFGAIMNPGDPEKFIRIPVPGGSAFPDLAPEFCHSLADLGLEVSTGPVVDFRLRQYLRTEPAGNTVPLLYPCHFADNRVQWPRAGTRKPNALLVHAETRKWLYPNGCYTVVRRFSAKEEKRRLVASVVRPELLPAKWLGFENHLNVFHHDKRGIPEDLALGLAVYLNSTLLDEHFRVFNGHTQVNATDLRAIKYPSRQTLLDLGAWARAIGGVSQDQIDAKMQSVR
jgi:adenine-specific DNA-methyltransferase